MRAERGTETQAPHSAGLFAFRIGGKLVRFFPAESGRQNQKEIKMANGRGGARSGAGRPVGARSKATKQAKATLADLAKAYAPEALKTLADVMRTGESESARVTAANSILDRGFGKPVQATTEIPADKMPEPFTGFLIERAQPDTPATD